MGQDAFALLKAGAKTKHEKPASTQQGKRQRKSDSSQPLKQSDQLKFRRQVDNATDTAQTAAPRTTPQAGSSSKQHLKHHSPSSTPQERKPPARNAFSILSASAEKAFQAHHFYCGLHDGKWQCEIWPVGQANPRLSHDTGDWTAQARVAFKPRSHPPATPEAQQAQPSTPTAQQAEVRLRSNIKGGTQEQPQTQDGRRLAAAQQQPLPLGERYSGGVPLLKSALQKCVRRRLARDATRLAHGLLAASPADALRRVAVMCIEDAVLHPQLPAVVWMMMAVAKGFVLTADHSALVIRVIWDLARASVRDVMPEDTAAQGCEDLMSVAKALPPEAAEARALVSCLLLRASYGGMGGDVSMLQSAAAVWLRRFQQHPCAETPPPEHQKGFKQAAAGVDRSWAALWASVFPDEAIPWTGIHQLRRRDFPLAGVDHHISRILTPLLSDDAVLEAVEELCDGGDFRGDDPESVLGSLLWQYRSGVSYKRPLSLCSPGHAGMVQELSGLASTQVAEELPALAKKICSLADEYSARFIARSFS